MENWISNALCVYTSLSAFPSFLYFLWEGLTEITTVLILFRLYLSCFIWFSNFFLQGFLTRERPFMSNLTWFVEIRRYAFLHFQKLNFNIFSGVETWTRQGLTKGDNLAIWWNNINVLILWHVSLECSSVG